MSRRPSGSCTERICIECGSWIRSNVPRNSRVCSEECRAERRIKSTSSVHSRHVYLLRILEREHCPQDDPLYSLNYFEAILLGNDGLCLYCDAEQDGSGIQLDRIDNKKPHRAFNVLGPVCAQCNSIRSNRLSPEEMFILRPKLIEIRELRELTIISRWRKNILKVNRQFAA